MDILIEKIVMDIEKSLDNIKQFTRSSYQKVDKLSGGILGIIVKASQRFTQERGSEAAASLAYYAFFSIFPMLLVFIVVGSFFVDQASVQEQLLNLLDGVVPGAEEIVIQNINRVLTMRGAVTSIALITLVWSATSVFNNLAKNINRAFPKATIPNFFEGRVVGLLMILGLGLLILLSFAATTISSLIPVINIPLNGVVLHETFLWQIGAFLVPVGVNTLMFWAIYHWVPMVKVSRRASFLGGLLVGVSWEILNNAFTWYLSSGLSQYSLVYGSVGSIVALLFWIYLTAILVLLGAHLTAAINSRIVDSRNDQQA